MSRPWAFTREVAEKLHRLATHEKNSLPISGKIRYPEVKRTFSRMFLVKPMGVVDTGGISIIPPPIYDDDGVHLAKGWGWAVSVGDDSLDSGGVTYHTLELKRQQEGRKSYIYVEFYNFCDQSINCTYGLGGYPLVFCSQDRYGNYYAVEYCVVPYISPSPSPSPSSSSSSSASPSASSSPSSSESASASPSPSSSSSSSPSPSPSASSSASPSDSSSLSASPSASSNYCGNCFWSWSEADQVWYLQIHNCCLSYDCDPPTYSGTVDGETAFTDCYPA